MALIEENYNNSDKKLDAAFLKTDTSIVKYIQDNEYRSLQL
jgi:hypothetical protein